MVKNIIFDLDDTLCDYSGAKERAIGELTKILDERNINSKMFWEKYKEIEPKLFEKFALKEITKEEYRRRRYLDIFNLIDNSIPNKEELTKNMNETYMDIANNKIELFPEVANILTELKKKSIKLIVLTNGPVDGQKNKVRITNLDKYIDEFYYSEVIGYAKPQKEAYEYVLKESRILMDETIMIQDFKEPQELGIKSYLIDRENKHIEIDESNKLKSINDVLNII